MLIRALQAAAGNFGVTGYAIDNSLRFNDNDSAYLSRTPATAGNRKTWTWSGWVKFGDLSLTFPRLFSTGTDANNRTEILFVTSTNQIRFLSTVGGVSRGIIDTNAYLLDASGWYHLVISLNASATALSVYVNGVEQALTVTTAIADVDHMVNATNAFNIGRYFGSGNYFDGYMAEINFIDGQALTADDFGQIDATTGEWSPKRYAGTYGTNGFYLPFDGNANDDSGNGNNWTENNLASTDFMIDTPTNNFSVFNSDALMSVSEGNLKATTNVTSSWQSVVSTIGVSSGKWYFETCAPQALSGPPYAAIGVASDPNFGQNTGQNYLGSTAGSWAYHSNGARYHNESGELWASSYTLGDVIGCALDMDAGTVEFFKNNVSQGVAYTGLTGTMFCGVSGYTTSGTVSNNINFGADSSFAGNKTRQGNTDANGKGDFYYAPPDGFLALCDDNLETLPFSASGGTETTITDGGVDYKVHTFTSSDTLYIQGIGQVEYLVVAGGGGGSGGNQSGGGGAGGVVTGTTNVSASAYTITVGAGGAREDTSGDGNNGNNSVAVGITALGGGGGGGADVGLNGGSGGGGRGGDASVNVGGTGLQPASESSGFGNDGGDSVAIDSGDNRAGGGGGGAGAAGQNAAAGVGGDGGDGIASTISGSSQYYGGGGGGGHRGLTNHGTGGLGGGGDGWDDNFPSSANGEVNTGGGGGGQGEGPVPANPRYVKSAGGSGIVIIRYPI